MPSQTAYLLLLPPIKILGYLDSQSVLPGVSTASFLPLPATQPAMYPTPMSFPAGGGSTRWMLHIISSDLANVGLTRPHGLRPGHQMLACGHAVPGLARAGWSGLPVLGKVLQHLVLCFALESVESLFVCLTLTPPLRLCTG